MLLINNEVVESVLTMDLTLTALDQAYRQHVLREAVCRPRIDIQIPTNDPKKVYRWGTMEGGSMSGYFAIRMKSDIIYETEYEGAVTQEKYCKQPGTYCGLILLFSVDNGEPLAILNDGVLQHMRVGADGGLGVKYAARQEVYTVGMLGSGGQARSHMAAFMQVRPNIKRLQVYSPTPANREKFAEEVRELYGIEVKVCTAPEQVYEDADILAAITDSAVQVINPDLIRPGMHIVNIGGGGKPGSKLFEKVNLYLRFGNVTAPWGLPDFPVTDEYLTFAAEPTSVAIPKMKHTGRRGHGSLVMEGAVSFEDIVHKDLQSARTNDAQISYSERGNLQGHQFWSVAGKVYEQARARGLGRELPAEWFLQNIRN
jgi:alanine dehydrogenase